MADAVGIRHDKSPDKEDKAPIPRRIHRKGTGKKEINRPGRGKGKKDKAVASLSNAAKAAKAPSLAALAPLDPRFNMEVDFDELQEIAMVELPYFAGGWLSCLDLKERVCFFLIERIDMFISASYV